MTGAMYAAISGLKAHMSALNVIGNNISNVNTNAYKAARYTFSEALYTSVRSGSDGEGNSGGRNPAQIGYGSSVGTIDTDMSTKNYSPTGFAMDCMIDGDGFFVMGTDKTVTGVIDQQSLKGMYLSRLGNFEFDANGYMVDGDGNLVYGFLRTGPTPEDPNVAAPTSPVLTPIRLPMCSIQENTTTGQTETIIHWPSVSVSTDNGGSAGVRDAGTGEDSNTGNTDEELKRLQAASVAIDEAGRITAMTNDQKLIVVGYVAIAKVDNPNGVTHSDGRYYQALGGAGDVHLSTVGGALTYIAPKAEDGGTAEINETNPSKITIESSGDTELVTGGLESSGTDLATEISNMIVIQRGYQANTRIVTVTDSMLEELVNMKR